MMFFNVQNKSRFDLGDAAKIAAMRLKQEK